MTTLSDILRVIHVITAILMAWPFYALVAVNQRIRLGPPLGDRTDVYMENIIKNRTIPCFVFQGTALVSGLLLVWLVAGSLSPLLTNAMLAAKFLLLVLIAGLLTYVHVSLQPAIDGLFARAAEQNPISEEVGQQIGALRLRRKRIASVCMFCVLTIVMLGVQVWAPIPFWLTTLLVLAIAVFTWRAFNSQTPYGWL